MITELSIVIRPEDEHNSAAVDTAVAQALSDKNISVPKEGFTSIILRRSVDARHGHVKICLRCKVYVGEKPGDTPAAGALPVWKHADGKKRVIIIGSGPAGLFGALRLLEEGIQPVIIERGAQTADRKRDIAAISTKGAVDANSNYCFGEGGAGTFSDGKLYTRSNKRGDIGRILRIFNAFGADGSILTDAHPHIGTDKLPAIVNAMRAKITELGGEFRFHSQCVNFVTGGAAPAGSAPRVTGIVVRDTVTGAESTLSADAVLLATGHSAADIYELLAKTAPAALEAKTFAVGVRCEHPRELIDAIQFHGKQMQQAAEYRLTAQIDERGVYSFCMCPGGFVVPSATAPGQIVINGMSSAARNSRWSNAAIVVETRPEDIPEEFRNKAAAAGCAALAGLYWRTWLEQETAKNGNGQQAPAQRLSDFIDRRDSASLPATSYTPGVVPSRLDKWLPPQIAGRLAEAFRLFNKQMRGYICPDALLIASETRTSTPVRILRGETTLECTALHALYPAGEGSGYSGGIVSSAMDGENVCGKIAAELKK